MDELIEKLIDAAGAEFTTCYYYTILRMYLAGHEDYKEICEDAWLEDRAHFELITSRFYEEDRRAGFGLICTGKPCTNLRLKTHALPDMRAHRQASEPPVPHVGTLRDK